MGSYPPYGCHVLAGALVISGDWVLTPVLPAYELGAEDLGAASTGLDTVCEPPGTYPEGAVHFFAAAERGVGGEGRMGGREGGRKRECVRENEREGGREGE